VSRNTTCEGTVFGAGYKRKPIVVNSRNAPMQKNTEFSPRIALSPEKIREFEELHSALIDEWKPSGPTEEDAVFSLADLMWRKRRAQYFLQSKLTVITRNPEHHAFDEEAGLPAFIEWMRAGCGHTC